VSFSANLFTIKGHLVVMNNFYHKLTVLSVCTALSFTLGTNKEAKAVTISLTATYGFSSIDYGGDGQEDYSDVSMYVGLDRPRRAQYTSIYGFNIANLSLDSNTVISNAFFEGSINNIESLGHLLYSTLSAGGYVSNENKVVSLGYIRLLSLSPGSIFKFDATTFVNQIVKNGQSFGEFRFSSSPTYGGFMRLENGKHPATLTITTVDVAEPVPEPTTIFGSALALGVGGWLKRKNPSRANKTTLQR
jgi:hypothetical protein